MMLEAISMLSRTSASGASSTASMVQSVDGGSAVSTAAKAGAVAPGATQGVEPVSGDFGDVLTRMITETVGTIRAGEAAAISGINGQASTQKVVAAVMAAEQSLQTAVVIRDKVVAAYLEISRMAI